MSKIQYSSCGWKSHCSKHRLYGWWFFLYVYITHSGIADIILNLQRCPWVVWEIFVDDEGEMEIVNVRAEASAQLPVKYFYPQ